MAHVTSSFRIIVSCFIISTIMSFPRRKSYKWNRAKLKLKQQTRKMLTSSIGLTKKNNPPALPRPTFTRKAWRRRTHHNIIYLASRKPCYAAKQRSHAPREERFHYEIARAEETEDGIVRVVSSLSSDSLRAIRESARNFSAVGAEEDRNMYWFRNSI